MAKANKPLFSLEAFGRIGAKLAARRSAAGAQVIVTTPPKDAKTSGQLAWRTMYQLAVSLWRALSAAEKETWESNARPLHMTGYAYFLSQALRPNPGIYLPLAGGTMTGEIAMSFQKITALATPTANTDASTKKYVDDSIAASPGVPTGVIVMWSGTLATIPAGWALCDGGGGRPDLRSKFIMGAPAGNEPGATGGSNTHSHDDHAALVHSGTAVANHLQKNTNSWSGANDGAAGTVKFTVGQLVHWHVITAYTHSVTQPNDHAAQSHSTEDNIPVYYTLAFIIKT